MSNPNRLPPISTRVYASGSFGISGPPGGCINVWFCGRSNCPAGGRDGAHATREKARECRRTDHEAVRQLELRRAYARLGIPCDEVKAGLRWEQIDFAVCRVVIDRRGTLLFPTGEDLTIYRADLEAQL